MREMTHEHNRMLGHFHFGLGDGGIILRQQPGHLLNGGRRSYRSAEDLRGLPRTQNPGVENR